MKDVLIPAGFKRSLVTGSFYIHKEWDMECASHGDDFLREGEPEALDRFDALMDRGFITKKLPRIGPEASVEGKYLTRVIGWSPKGFT